MEKDEVNAIYDASIFFAAGKWSAGESLEKMIVLPGEMIQLNELKEKGFIPPQYVPEKSAEDFAYALIEYTIRTVHNIDPGKMNPGVVYKPKEDANFGYRKTEDDKIEIVQLK